MLLIYWGVQLQNSITAGYRFVCLWRPVSYGMVGGQPGRNVQRQLGIAAFNCENAGPHSVKMEH